jgi:hypothetical protein
VMTFEEAERFRWNPFDLTKVKLLSVKLCSGYIYTARILHYQVSWKYYHRWWIGSNSLFKASVLTFPWIDWGKLQKVPFRIGYSLVEIQTGSWPSQKSDWLNAGWQGLYTHHVQKLFPHHHQHIMTGHGAHLACWTVDTNKSYLLDEAVRARG